MTEAYARVRQYEYNQNASLVLEADRDSRRISEPTGEAESLHGRLGNTKMGDRVARGKPPELLEKMERARKKRARHESAESEQRKRTRGSGSVVARHGSTVLTETEELDSVSYRPKTALTRRAYEEILAIVQQCVGDQPQDIICGAAEELIAIMKNDEVVGPAKQSEAAQLLGSLKPQRFNKLSNLAKQITDFTTEEEDEEGETKLDDDLGVAVVFDEEEEEDSDLDEIRESDESEDEGGVEAHGDGKLTAAVDDESHDDGRNALTVPVDQIDAYWLQRELSKYYEDANVSQKLSEDVLSILSGGDERECENKLVMLLDFDKFQLIKVLLHNRSRILYCTRLKQAQTDEERENITAEMIADVSGGGAAILQELNKTRSAESWTADRMGDFARLARQEARQLGRMQAEAKDGDVEGIVALGSLGADGARGPRPQRTVDLDALEFSNGGHLMSNKRCELPENSWRAQKKGYEEVHVPALKPKPMMEGEVAVRISDMPEWTHGAFSGMKTLNRVQSRVYSTALNSSENLLLCAPTGAGKTNVAVLTMLHEIGQHIRADGSVDGSKFKIVYVAPMKALVQEMVANLTQRLTEAYGVKVAELSGDAQMSKQQINETQIIVTTPEKWDIITRKSGERTYTQLVRLVIMDEIHLLHDDRGPVLESLVARTLRQVETTQEMVRLVGLSATLPNYEDVATFMRVKPDVGLFFFDNSFRPCPMEQQYIGITEKKAIKRFATMNQITYEKVMHHAGKDQVLIFVHSRKETATTAKAVRDLALAEDTLGQFMHEESATREILQVESDAAKNLDLKELLPYGFAIHHAGMTRADRNLVEDLFADGHIQVLVSTATLAWGVNLPAHVVIVKGTQVYNPEKGRWGELSPQDMMQMLGRAGRPQYDSFGEGIIITTHSELQYYLSLMNQQLPIESQFVKRLADNLNAEITMGAVQNVREAATWLGYTYLYVRMLRAPALYGVPASAVEDDPLLLQHRLDLVHSAAAKLDKHGLIKYDRKSGVFVSTPLGRVASHYYVSYTSMATFNDHLKPTMSDIELFRLFSLSGEFKFIVVRQEEKMELATLLRRVPVPVKEGVEEPSAKVNVLLQAYISRLNLEGFALVADMVYVQQSAGRILRALFEICIRRGWSGPALKTLQLCQMVERRMWRSQTPMRQFKGIPRDILKKLERQDIAWDRYFDLKPADLGELVRYPRMGRTLHKAIHQFPRLELSAHVQPITRSVLRVALTLVPDFQMDPVLHGTSVGFHIIVEDVDGDSILHYQWFLLKRSMAETVSTVTFTVPLADPMPPQYFVRVVADRWLHSETVLPVSFRHLLLPEKYPPHTELLDLQPLPVGALRDPVYEALYSHRVDQFNPVQTQAFNTLYETDQNVLLAAPTGSGKTICAEFAILRMLKNNPGGRCVYLAALEELAAERMRDWGVTFGTGLGVRIARLSGDTTADLKILADNQILIATAEQWDILSRRWKQRRAVQEVALVLVDEIHLIGGEVGPVLEVVVSRMRYIASQVERPIRIVALSTSLSNATDLAEWLGAGPHGLFNFHPTVRPVPLDLHIMGFDTHHFASRLLAMAKPLYNAVEMYSPSKPVLVFVPSRRQAQLSAIDLLTFAAAAEAPRRFLNRSKLTDMDVDRQGDGDGDGDAAEDTAMSERLDTLGVSDAALRHTLSCGVGFLHSGSSAVARRAVKTLYMEGTIQVVVAEHGLCWGMELAAQLVVVMDTQSYDGRQRSYTDYPITNLLQMMGRACRPRVDSSGRCLIMCHSSKKEYLRKFLYSPLPVESHLDHCLHDTFNAEIVTKTVENKQDAVDYLTWTFLYRRIAQNPNYYNLQGSSHRHLSDYLSDLVEATLGDLSTSGAISVREEMYTSPLNLGMIAAYYYIKYTTVELFASSLTANTKMRGLLEILSNASEFDSLPVRRGEEATLRAMANHCPLALTRPDFSEAHTKVNILLQAHFSRSPLSAELRADQQFVLERSLRLLQAMVDVISSNGWLKPALAAMELSQMVTQALWDKDSILRQMPHVDTETAKRLEDAGAESVFDVMDLEDESRDALLRLSGAQMAEVAMFCNGYPNVDLDYSILDPETIATGGTVRVKLQIERDDGEDDDGEGESKAAPPKALSRTPPAVLAPLYPGKRVEGWWVIVGDPSSGSLVSIKRLSFGDAASVTLEFASPDTAGESTYTLCLMSDSYLGCDQEYELQMTVAQGESESEDSDESDSD